MGMAAAIIAASVSSARRRIAASFEDKSPRSHSGAFDSTAVTMRLRSWLLIWRGRYPSQPA
jgi:hypothetical protein